MSVHLPAALARSGACSIQTISSRSLPGTVTARPRLTRSAKRARIITELYPGHAGQQQVAVIERADQTDPMRANFASPSGAKRERLGTSREAASPPCQSSLRVNFLILPSSFLLFLRPPI